MPEIAGDFIARPGVAAVQPRGFVEEFLLDCRKCQKIPKNATAPGSRSGTFARLRASWQECSLFRLMYRVSMVVYPWARFAWVGGQGRGCRNTPRRRVVARRAPYAARRTTSGNSGMYPRAIGPICGNVQETCHRQRTQTHPFFGILPHFAPVCHPLTLA